MTWRASQRICGLRSDPSQASLQLAIIVLDPTADLGQAHQFFDGSVGGEGAQPESVGSPRRRLRPAASSLGGCDRPGGGRRPAGRTRIARKWLVMAASGLPRVFRVPCRQATGRIWPAAAWPAGAGSPAGAGTGLGRLAAPGVGRRLRTASAGCALVVPLTAPRTATRQRPAPHGTGHCRHRQLGHRHRAGAPGHGTCSSSPQPPGPVISSIISSASRHFSVCRTWPGMRDSSRRRRARPRPPDQLAQDRHRIPGRIPASPPRTRHARSPGARSPRLAVADLAQRPEYCRATHGDAAHPWGSQCHRPPAPPPLARREPPRHIVRTLV